MQRLFERPLLPQQFLQLLLYQCQFRHVQPASLSALPDSKPAKARPSHTTPLPLLNRWYACAKGAINQATRAVDNDLNNQVASHDVSIDQYMQVLKME